MTKYCWNVAAPHTHCTTITYRVYTPPKKSLWITIRKAQRIFLKTRMKSMRNASWSLTLTEKLQRKKRTFKIGVHTHFDLSAITIKIESNCNLLRLIKKCGTFCSVLIWCEFRTSLFLEFFSFVCIRTCASTAEAHSLSMKNGF